MRTRIVFGALLAMAFSVPAMAATAVRIGINIGVPAPAVVYQSEPRWVMTPEERVYVVDDEALDYDYFRYGGSYWIFANDCWYRGAGYRGPFEAVRVDRVPEPIWRVGGRGEYRWRHHPAGLPPGLARKYARNHTTPGWERREDRREDRRQDRHEDRRDDRGHGNGKGKDRDNR